jgi:hypothetical protein
MRTECLLDPGASARLAVRIRFLHVQRRVEGAGLPWDEAVERSVDIGDIEVLPLAGVPRDVPFRFAGGEDVCDGVVRRLEQVDGVVRVRAAWADGPTALVKVSVTVENTSPWRQSGATRADTMRWSLVAVHTLLAVEDGAFVSLLDPPDHAVVAAQGCASDGTYPVLVGDGHTEVVLSSPIILYDHPAIAKESAGDLFDSTEIDEILALRVLTLTDDEKAEARRTDARAAAIVDRIAASHLTRGLASTARCTSWAAAEAEPRPGGSQESTDRTTPSPTSWWSAAGPSRRARRCGSTRAGAPTRRTCFSGG